MIFLEFFVLFSVVAIGITFLEYISWLAFMLAFAITILIVCNTKPSHSEENHCAIHFQQHPMKFADSKAIGRAICICEEKQKLETREVPNYEICEDMTVGGRK